MIFCTRKEYFDFWSSPCPVSVADTYGQISHYLEAVHIRNLGSLRQSMEPFSQVKLYRCCIDMGIIGTNVGSIGESIEFKSMRHVPSLLWLVLPYPGLCEGGSLNTYALYCAFVIQK